MRLKLPGVVGGLLGVLSVVFSVGVAAQPRGRGGAAGADAGTKTTGATSATTTSDGGAGTASGATTSASDASAPDGTGAAPAATDTSAAPVPTFKPHAPPLPPPTMDQVSAFQALNQESESFAQGARDYKDAITTIITLHYEEKKRVILGGLDREIGIEKDELRKARDVAIQRLEAFVAKYSGDNAQPQETPDAMYRLAALYEERGRESDDPNLDLAVALKPAVLLYKRIIREFPKYNEISAIYYYLGYALSDSRRSNESQQVFRSLVCHNHYPYPVATDPKDPDIDQVGALPQDNTADYWKTWRSKYPTPESIKKGPKVDVTFNDPYPADCTPLPQPDLLPGQDPKYVAEIWWRIGDWEFDQLDMGGGVMEFEPSAVWDYNRAASAYQRSMKFKKPPVFGVALYKYAWTLFKQQRYQAAVGEFVHLLDYTDEQQKLTGNPGADFRSEAYTYIAGSLDNYDFAGPGPDEPYIARPDVLETMPPIQAEQKLHIAIDRVQDPKLIPQDRPWTIEVYKALALEYRAINQYQNALAVYQLTLDKWPMDPSAPDTQNAIADVYELLVKSTKVGTERTAYEGKVLEARTALAKYIGETPWVDANKDNPAALQRAEELVRTGLKGAAVTHTLNAQAAFDQAKGTSDAKEQIRLTVYSMQEYKLAALGWLGYLKQDENAPDAYKSRYFYADALHNEVRLEVALHGFDARTYPEPTSQEIATASAAAAAVRDSDEDDAYIDNAGSFVVDLADVERDLAYQRFKDSNGTQGIEPLTDAKLEGPEGQKKVVVSDIPDVIQRSMSARDEYVQRVPPDRDTNHNALTFQYYVANEYFVYGHFKEARDRFQPMYEQNCGKNEWGYNAWKKLIIMSNDENDTTQSRKLAEAETAHSCAVSDTQKTESKSGALTTNVLTNAAFSDANALYEQAKAAPPGPAKDDLWRKAADAYGAALKAAPGHKDAPAAAINSAFCYKQVGDFSHAIDNYNLFIANYGSDDNLNRLQNGGIDPDTKQKVPPDPDQYKERIKYLGMAYDALSSTYYGFFAYQKAADSFAKIANNQRFDDPQRANAARIGMVLYSNLGDRTNMTKMYNVMIDPAMHTTSDKRAEADALKANFDYAQWNPSGADSGGNSAARQAAIASLTTYHNANKSKPEAARYVLEASYHIAKMMQAANDPGYRNWFKTTIADWENFKSHPQVITTTTSDGKTSQSQVTANQAPFADYGGEADFTLVDEQVRAAFDYDTGHHHYAGNVQDVIKAVDKDLGEAEKTWKPPLDSVATKYGSFQWAAAATAREGTLYDSIRTGLDLVVPQYFTPKQQALLNKLQKIADQLNAANQSDQADKVQQQIDDTKDAVRNKWRSTKDQYLEVCNQNMIRKYVTSAMIARKYNVKDPTVQKAVARLAFFTDYLGDDKMKGYVENTSDPLDSSGNTKLAYLPGEFLQWRSGVVSAPPANGSPAPLPAAP
jgi:hypothetical protein